MTAADRRKFILAHHPDWKIGRERDFMPNLEGHKKDQKCYYTEVNGKRVWEGSCDACCEWLIIKDIENAANQKSHF